MASVVRKLCGAVVMVVPLAALAAMWFFGIPRLTPHTEWSISSVTTGTRHEVADKQPARAIGSVAEPHAIREGARITRPLSATRRRSRDGQPPLSADSTVAMSEDGTTRSAKRVATNDNGLPSEGSSRAMTWQTVRRELAVLGVYQFKIQPGTRPGEVHFSCVTGSPGSIRVTRRYEAEAGDPVEAAGDVLRQLQAHQARHSPIARAR